MKCIYRLFAALLIATAPTIASAGYSSIIAFGDSLSDNGNAFRLSNGQIPPPPYVDGRVSNGPVAVEYMADALGLNLVDFAILGAKTGPDSKGIDNFRSDLGLNGTGMPNQVAAFACAQGGCPAPLVPLVPPGAQISFPDAATSLFLVWGGANDLFDFSIVNPEQSAANVGGLISNLYALGARNFFVPNLPDLGRIPDFLGSPVEAPISGASQLFNVRLAGEILSLDVSLPDATIIPFDTYSVFNEVLANPDAFGFTDVTNACLAFQSCAADEDVQKTTLFWDGAHPTTAAHALFGQAFANAASVPEPATLMLLGAALVLLGIQRRQRTVA